MAEHVFGPFRQVIWLRWEKPYENVVKPHTAGPLKDNGYCVMTQRVPGMKGQNSRTTVTTPPAPPPKKNAKGGVPWSGQVRWSAVQYEQVCHVHKKQNTGTEL